MCHTHATLRKFFSASWWKVCRIIQEVSIVRRGRRSRVWGDRLIECANFEAPSHLISIWLSWESMFGDLCAETSLLDTILIDNMRVKCLVTPNYYLGSLRLCLLTKAATVKRDFYVISIYLQRWTRANVRGARERLQLSTSLLRDKWERSTSFRRDEAGDYYAKYY